MGQRSAADRSTLTDTDQVTVDEIRDLAAASTPCVSFHMPTHRHGAEVRQDPVRLRNLLDTATRQLREHEVPAAQIDNLLEPVRALLDESEFWKHQADGLSIFAAPGQFQRFRLALEPRESVTVGDTFHVAPLTPVLSGDGSFLVLALSQHTLRLFEASRSTVNEIDTTAMRSSIAEAVERDDLERQLQSRSTGSGEAQFHGHGAGEEYDKASVERFLRAVDHSLHQLLGADQRPLVLACVGYYLPVFRSLTRSPSLVERAVEGNPERVSPAELHAAAWPLVEPLFQAEAAQAVERYRASLGTGGAVDGLDEVAERAAQGRVDLLVVDPDRVDLHGSDAPVDLRLDRAILDTLSASGTVVCSPEPLPNGSVAGAVLRY